MSHVQILGADGQPLRPYTTPGRKRNILKFEIRKAIHSGAFAFLHKYGAKELSIALTVGG